MTSFSRDVFIGTDSGATTSKTCGVWADGTPISLKVRQSATPSQRGTAAVVAGWVEGVDGFLADHGLSWTQVRGVGLALPGPYLRYGVLDRSANLPASFTGWNFHADYAAARYQLARVYRELGEAGKADAQLQAFHVLEARAREQRRSMKRQY